MHWHSVISIVLVIFKRQLNQNGRLHNSTNINIMKLKHLLFALTFAGTALPLMAQEEGNYLHLQTATGWEVIDLDQVDRLTFSNGTMTASDKDQTTVASFRQDQLISMNYSETSGIESVTDDNMESTFYFDSDAKAVIMKADGIFEVFSEAGVKLVEIPSAKNGETINLSAIRKGIVILKSGSHSLKAIIK